VKGNEGALQVRQSGGDSSALNLRGMAKARRRVPKCRPRQAWCRRRAGLDWRAKRGTTMTR
jgi:hypothetical protein